ncbi:MAG: hypothetical protein EXR47_08680 [Dehalococcoidia bacterium]|nr:hypothetical protein [Dehalococcoidia bacterium]
MTTLRHWEPAHELEEMHRTLDRLFDSFGQPSRFPAMSDGANGARWLPLDVYEESDHAGGEGGRSPHEAGGRAG